MFVCACVCVCVRALDVFQTLIMEKKVLHTHTHRVNGCVCIYVCFFFVCLSLSSSCSFWAKLIFSSTFFPCHSFTHTCSGYYGFNILILFFYIYINILLHSQCIQFRYTIYILYILNKVVN